MSLLFEEIDSQDTPIGEISLRRRADPRLGGKIIYEVKLGDEYLMSSLFPEAEIQLSTMGVAALKQSLPQNNQGLDIIVGGLGLGYTAVAALEGNDVSHVVVIDILAAVIDWHQQGLVPLGDTLNTDPRCELRHDDFFMVATNTQCGFYPDEPERLAHGVLLDIDHSPSHWLAPENSRFYSVEGLQQLSNKLHAGGVFGLWSNDLPDPAFSALLDSVFARSEAHVVSFSNPYTGEESANSVYLAFKA